MSDGAPVLEGDLAAFGVFEVIAFLAASGRRCVCEFRFPGGIVKRVHLDAGDIVFATSSVTDDRLGESLVRARQISQVQLDVAARAISATNRLGKVLVDMGCLTPRGLYDAVRRQIEEIVASLFAFERGRFVVTLGLPEGSTRVRLSAPTREFILDLVSGEGADAGSGKPSPARAAPARSAPAGPVDPSLARIVHRYDQALAAITKVMRAHGVDPEQRLAEFVAGGDSARVALFQGVRLGTPAGLDVRQLLLNADFGAPVLAEPVDLYLEAGLEELFAYSLFAVQDLVAPAEAEALASQLRTILSPAGGR